MELKLHGMKIIENGLSGSTLSFIHFESRKKKGSPFHLEHDREQVGGKEQDKDRLVSPGEPRRESSESIVTGEESGSKEGNVDIVWGSL